MNLAEAILAAPDRAKCVPVEMPEWNLTVYVTELSADERDELETIWLKHRGEREDNIGFRAFTVAFCLCDADGKRLFADDPVKAAEALGVKRGHSITRIFNVATRLNAITRSDQEELEKNSETTPSDAGSGA